MKRVASWLIVGGLVLVLGVVNYDIYTKQHIVETGRQILLRLRPIDPRSLIQGDFMLLRYSEEVFPDSVRGSMAHLEHCAQFREAENEFVIVNGCNEAVIVEFLPDRGRALKFEIQPQQSSGAGMHLPSSYIYTVCPLDHVSSVPITTSNRGMIRNSNYRCIEASEARRARTGAIVLALDADGVGIFRRYDDGTPLERDEAKLRYKYILAMDEFRLGAESFFFEEGQAEIYAEARFGVLRVDEDGASVLVGLAGDDRQLLAPPQ